MPKVNNFKVKIETGDIGRSGPIHFNFNNHKVPFDDVKGGTGPDEVFEGAFEVNSYAHSMNLVGPESGQWKVKSITIDYECESIPPYTVKFGEVLLDDTTEANILQDPPLPTFDV